MSSSEKINTDAAVAELSAALADEDTQSQAGEAISAALNSEEVRRKAYEDVKVLATTIRNIRKGFMTVAADFIGFDSANFVDINGKPIKLGPRWAPHITLFDQTLQYSLEQATQAVVLMKSVSAVLGDVTPSDAADLRLELESFVKILAMKEEAAAQVKTKWTALADQVRLFSSVIDTALLQAEEPIKVELNKARIRLNDLQSELKDINEKIHRLGVSIISSAAVGVAAAGVAIATLNPAAFFTFIGSLVTLIGTAITLKKALTERGECQKNIEKVNRDIVVLNERLELLKKYRAKFEGTKGTIGEIADQINVIGNIWQTIGSDMRALNTDLTNNLAGGGPVSKFFIKRLQVSKDIYRHLTLLLETYVEQVNSAGNT